MAGQSGIVNRATGALIAGLLLWPAVALAQKADSTKFLDAVRDRDGNKATELIGQSGNAMIDTRDPSTGEGVLHIVIKGRDLNWLNFMLAKGANPNLRDKAGDTPLMEAAQIGFVEGARQLLAARASVDLANAGRETPLIRASQRGDVAMVRLLLAAGANPALTDAVAGLSARDYAVRNPRAAAVLRLIDTARPVQRPKMTGPGRQGG